MENGADFEGTWGAIEAEFEGERAPAEFTSHAEVELRAGNYFVRYGGVTADQGTYFVDEQGLTLVGMKGPNAGKTIPCLHKFAGGDLVVCYGLSGRRPARFHTGPGSQTYLATYRRRA